MPSVPVGAPEASTRPRGELGAGKLAPQPLTEADFAALESALLETERGRQFLAEVARRRRAEDAARVLAAIERLEARAARGEVEQARRRLEAERAGEVVRQLAEVLKDLRPLADSQTRARILAARGGVEPRPAKDKPDGLERRFAALVELDKQDLGSGLTQFG